MKAVRIINLILAGSLMVSNCHASTPSVCLRSLSTDSRSFGHALAVSDDYLAVGDPEANRVVIYRRNNDDQWLRTREVLPPKGSLTDKVGTGFGYSLALNEDRLIVGAYIERQHKFDNHTQFEGAVYSVLLGSEDINPIEEIQTPPDMIVGYALSIFENQVAIGGRIEKAEGKWVGNVLIADIVNDEIIKAISPPTPEAAELFGISVGIDNNVLIAGAPFDPPEGAAWLFDLANQKQPYRIAGKFSSTAFAGSSVAIGKGFAAVSASGESWGQLRTVIKTQKAVRLVLSILARVSCLTMNSCYFSSPPVCLESLPSDSPSFGFSLATSGDYLAVGDPDANRVVIYTRNQLGRWIRTREIVPPSGSVADQVGSGFGYELAIDGTVLVIGAFVQVQTVK